MPIQMLRPESVTPIDLYVAASAANPTAFRPQLDLALALLYREREYRVMYLARLHPDPRPRPDSPFHPHDITPAAAAVLARALPPEPEVSALEEPPPPEDLFGLKADVTARLTRVLRGVAAHRMGWVVAALLYDDLRRHSDAIQAGEQAADLGAPLLGLALAHRAALAGAHMASLGITASAVPNGARIARAIGVRVRRERLGAGARRRWTAEAERLLDDWLTKNGVAVRRRVEGQAFERFLTSESKFCDETRRTAMASFDLAHVPPDLRHLVPLAQTIGVGDDPCRSFFVRKMSKKARHTAVAQIREAAGRIQQWLDRLTPPHTGAAEAYYWLLVGAEEMAGGD